MSTAAGANQPHYDPIKDITRTTPSPKEAQIKEQYDNTEPSGKAEQDAIKEAPDYLDELKTHLEHSFTGFFRATPQQDTYTDVEIAVNRAMHLVDAAIAQHIAEQVEAVIDTAIQQLQEEYDRKKKQTITKSNRPKFARDNETVGESYCRRQGYLGGLLTAQRELAKLRREE